MPNEIYNKMAKNGIRIFMLGLYCPQYHEQYWVHNAKTPEDWQLDVNIFLNKTFLRDGVCSAEEVAHNSLQEHLCNLGYIEVTDLLSAKITRFIEVKSVDGKVIATITIPDGENDGINNGFFIFDRPDLNSAKNNL